MVDEKNVKVDNDANKQDDSQSFIQASQNINSINNPNSSQTQAYSSISKKTNTVIATVKPNTKLEFNYDGFNETDKIAINEWFTYCSEVKKPYKSQLSLTKLRNKLLELKASITLTVAIDHSIAARYSGVFAPLGNARINSPPKKTANYVSDFSDPNIPVVERI
jgi:hypothetical protein